jgi:hypothetical protein
MLVFHRVLLLSFVGVVVVADVTRVEKVGELEEHGEHAH